MEITPTSRGTNYCIVVTVFSAGTKEQLNITDSNINPNIFNTDLFNFKYVTKVVGIIYNNFSE